MPQHKRIALALCAMFLLAGIGMAQDSLRVSVNLVLLDVSVRDKDGRAVTNLGQDNFQVYEDRIEQPISYFSSEESPVTWGVVVDRSGSMADMDNVYDAALHMTRTGTTEDEMFVMTFSRRIDTQSGMTLDRRKLQNAMFGIHAKGSTALYDTVDTALDYIKQGAHRKKALLVITDGVDNKSRVTFRQLINRAKESDVLIYTVGINTPEGMFAKGNADRDRLNELAEVTGGYAHFPTDPAKCEAVMAEIAREASEHYTIGFYPVNANYDGKYRKLKVVVKDSESLRTKYAVRSRTGYYAKPPENNEF